MAFAFKHNDELYRAYGLRKHSGYVKQPQLFYGRKPILPNVLGNVIPKVSSEKWCCYCADPEQDVTQWNLNGDKLARFSADMIFSFPVLSRSKKTDCNSGLTVTVKGLVDLDNVAYPNTALRITRSSISTNYINVFAWSFIVNRPQSPLTASYGFAQWSNDGDWLYTSQSMINPAYERNSAVYDRKIDGAEPVALLRWGTIKKATSGTYLYVMPPLHKSMEDEGNRGIRGWGIILEPTNSNTYPV